MSEPKSGMLLVASDKPKELPPSVQVALITKQKPLNAEEILREVTREAHEKVRDALYLADAGQSHRETAKDAREAIDRALRIAERVGQIRATEAVHAMWFEGIFAPERLIKERDRLLAVLREGE
jgi:hypothetical protein